MSGSGVSVLRNPFLFIVAEEPRPWGYALPKVLNRKPRKTFLKKVFRTFQKILTTTCACAVCDDEIFFAFGEKTDIPLSRFPFGKRCRRIFMVRARRARQECPKEIGGDLTNTTALQRRFCAPVSRSETYEFGGENPQGLKPQTSENFFEKKFSEPFKKF
jgi:hypothetical protein